MGNTTVTTIEENKALILRFFSVIESNNLDVFDSIVAEDYDDHLAGQSPGRDVLKKYFAGLHTAFADLRFPVWAMIAEGDRVVVYNSVQGTHRSDYGPFEAKGNPVDAHAFQMYRIENGQLAEH